MTDQENQWLQFEKFGFAALPIWGGVINGKVTLKFSDGITVGHTLDGNKERTLFDALEIVPEEWKNHGVKNVHVEIVDEQSIIYVTMSESDEPLKCTKDYR